MTWCKEQNECALQYSTQTPHTTTRDLLSRHSPNMHQKKRRYKPDSSKPTDSNSHRYDQAQTDKECALQHSTQTPHTTTRDLPSRHSPNMHQKKRTNKPDSSKPTDISSHSHDLVQTAKECALQHSTQTPHTTTRDLLSRHSPNMHQGKRKNKPGSSKPTDSSSHSYD